ncbi:hypothetical protein PoMZ_12767 [Pyricularia oryzae]|nr:hypothetical protein PoMZ_12767 [Pyricularia oryzae]
MSLTSICTEYRLDCSSGPKQTSNRTTVMTLHDTR